ncbi:MAG: hypothetical protein QM680_04585 [Luteolibacter sp.]
MSGKVSVYFDEVVAEMREEGISAIQKSHFKIQDDGRPVMVSGKWVGISEARDLKKPEFWMPVGYDGEAWKIKLCAPDWMKGKEAIDWFSKHEESFRWRSEGEVSEDSEDYIHHELATFRATAKPRKQSGDVHPLAVKLARTSVGYLEQAMLKGYEFGGGFPPKSRADLRDGEVLFLEPKIARIMELVYRAGYAAARSSLYYRGIPDDARKGKKLVDAQHQVRGTIMPWIQEAEKFLTENPHLVPEKPKIRDRTVSEFLKGKGIIIPDYDNQRIGIEGENREIKWKSFQQEIRRICTRISRGT